MYRINNNFLEFSIVSGVYGFFSEFFLGINYSFIILMFFIITDTVTGIASAMKYQRLSSKGIIKLVKKILTYSLSVAVVRLFEIAIGPFSNGTLISQIFLAYLLLVELISILENLTLLGVPLPNNVISLLLKYTKIPGVEKLVTDPKSNLISYTSEIDDMIDLQLKTIDNNQIQMLVEIKLLTSKKTILHIASVNKNRDQLNNELFYYKILAIVQNGNKETEERWRLAEINTALIRSFKEQHKEKDEQLMQQIKNTAYLEANLNEKIEIVIKGIIVTLYQTIIDAKKISKT